MHTDKFEKNMGMLIIAENAQNPSENVQKLAGKYLLNLI
jgi:hypothetical protein